MRHIDKLLARRLNKIGLEPDLVPVFISFASTICRNDSKISVADLNKKLVQLGWHDFELDYRTHELLMSYIENELASSL
jgi:hypothetical protein